MGIVKPTSPISALALPEHGKPDNCHAALLMELVNPQRATSRSSKARNT